MSVNAACIRARHFDSNFNGRERKNGASGAGAIKPGCSFANHKIPEIKTPKPGAGQSERFSDIGVARRRLGVVRCPAAV